MPPAFGTARSEMNEIRGTRQVNGDGKLRPADTFARNFYIVAGSRVSLDSIVYSFKTGDSPETNSPELLLV